MTMVLKEVVVVVVVMFGAFLPSVLAAVALRDVTDPRYPGICYTQMRGRTIKLKDGQSETLPGCHRVSCNQFYEDMYLEMATCGVINVQPPCVTRSDIDLPYPECCPRKLCPPARVAVHRQRTPWFNPSL